DVVAGVVREKERAHELACRAAAQVESARAHLREAEYASLERRFFLLRESTLLWRWICESWLRMLQVRQASEHERSRREGQMRAALCRLIEHAAAMKAKFGYVYP